MNRSLIVLALAGALSACNSLGPQQTAMGLKAAAPESAQFSEAKLKKITAAFQAEVDAGRLPGMVMAVARQGQIVYHEAIGKQDVTTGKAMEKDAVFGVARF